MWEFTYRDIHVYEASNGFYITHIPTNETRGMGDGVDMYEDTDVGTPEFYELLEEDIVSNYREFLEAYFNIVE